MLTIRVFVFTFAFCALASAQDSHEAGCSDPLIESYSLPQVSKITEAAQGSVLKNDPSVLKTIGRLQNDESHSALLKDRILAAWAKKCGDLYGEKKFYKCELNECDIGVPSCRKDRVLLFRGESGKYPYSGVSPLLRNVLGGIQFGSQSQTPTELLELLKKKVDLLKPKTSIWEGDATPLLIQENGDFGWRMISDLVKTLPLRELLLQELPPVPRTGSRSMPIGAFLFRAQSRGYGALSVLDSSLGLADISPLVSLSFDPETSIRFATRLYHQPQNGRLIVLSVPKNKIASSCGTLGRSGSIGNYNSCIKRDEDNETLWERELDATLFIDSQYILYSLDVPTR